MSKKSKDRLAVLDILLFWVSIVGLFVASQHDMLWILLIVITLPYYLIIYIKENDREKKQFDKSLPNGIQNNLLGYMVLKSKKNSNKIFKLSSPIGVHNYWHADIKINKDDNPIHKKYCFCLLRNKQIILLHNKRAGQHYYLASINFKPDIQIDRYTTTKGHVKGRAGSTLGGAAIGSLVGAPLIGALVGHSRKRKIKTETQFHRNKNEYPTTAYLQLVTRDFKHIKQIKLENVETYMYKLLSRKCMLNNSELKELQK